jgi:hypothetical protein
MLYANLPQPWLVLRILSSVMDRPSDRYVAVSELARFGEYLLDDVDRRIALFRAFNPDRGRESGVAVSEGVQAAFQVLAEFDAAIDLQRDGPWGRRIIKQRQALAGLAEARYADIEKALDHALPLQMVRFGKGLRPYPKLLLDPDPRLLLRAEGLVGFFDHSKVYASQSGFGAARARTAQMMQERLDQYVEDLLEMLRADEFSEMDRVRAYLDVCADFIEATRGREAAQLVRRRAAA